MREALGLGREVGTCWLDESRLVVLRCLGIGLEALRLRMLVRKVASGRSDLVVDVALRQGGRWEVSFERLGMVWNGHGEAVWSEGWFHLLVALGQSDRWMMSLERLGVLSMVWNGKSEAVGERLVISSWYSIDDGASGGQYKAAENTGSMIS